MVDSCDDHTKNVVACPHLAPLSTRTHLQLRLFFDQSRPSVLSLHLNLQYRVLASASARHLASFPIPPDSAHVSSPLSMVTVTRAKCMSMDASSPADLSSLQVKVGELRLTADGTWLYVLQVTCGRARWSVSKRYSEIRELWLEIGKTLADSDAHASCTERCHFLAGLEQDKFPKKHLLLTHHKLEARASELDQFFLKLAMRLNLCKPHELHMCRLRGCPLLALIAGFFDVDAEQAKTRAAIGFQRSISMQRELQRHDQQFTKKRRGSISVSMGVGLNGRFSFGFQDRHSAVAALAQ